MYIYYVHASLYNKYTFPFSFFRQAIATSKFCYNTLCITPGISSVTTCFSRFPAASLRREQAVFFQAHTFFSKHTRKTILHESGFYFRYNSANYASRSSLSLPEIPTSTHVRPRESNAWHRIACKRHRVYHRTCSISRLLTKSMSPNLCVYVKMCIVICSGPRCVIKHIHQMPCFA